MSDSRILFLAAFLAMTTAAAVHVQGADSNYQVVENWAEFPDGVTAWSPATGVDIDSQGNIYVFHRNASMPIMAFDQNGKFLRAWGHGMFKTTHFLRTDREGNVWVTDRGDHQVFKFSPGGKLPVYREHERRQDSGQSGRPAESHGRDRRLEGRDLHR